MAITHILKQSTVRIKDIEKQFHVFSEQTFRSGGHGVANNVTRVTVPHSSLNTSGRHPCARSELGVADEAINKNRVCLPPPQLGEKLCAAK